MRAGDDAILRAIDRRADAQGWAWADEVAHELGRQAKGMGPILGRLERLGLVERRAHGAYAPALWGLTDEGWRAASRSLRVQRRV